MPVCCGRPFTNEIKKKTKNDHISPISLIQKAEQAVLYRRIIINQKMDWISLNFKRCISNMGRGCGLVVMMLGS